MQLVDPQTSMMTCMVCGYTHCANIKPASGGRFHRGAWQCANGCQPEDAVEQPEQPSAKEVVRG